ncbi:gap junction Cx32.2 protein-like [Lampris incognitus]|uniref:gap junction Cx32.2 protein-like n=1 Tax=Lampris incognitus TaxID=2546036 RepID=UPI0024B58C84|nr:gap junction Cx32.2 protein-like [Lampris incognitus]
MGDWSYLASLLDKVQSHSTVVGKVWMSVLFLFRILVLGAAADNVWGDEHSDFFCNNQEPGCQHACYNWMFPISYIRYWVLQILFVSTPTLVYLGHAVHVIHREKRLREQLQNKTEGALFLKKPKYTDDRGKVKIKGILLRSYLTQLVFKILLEVGFGVGQFYIFGPIFLVSFFHCKQSPPCALSSGAECFISRPTEKTIFIIFMLVVAGVSVLLNIIEIIYLLCAWKKRGADKHIYNLQPPFSLQQPYVHSPSGPAWAAQVNSRHGGSFPSPPPQQELLDICKDDSCSDLVSKEKHT